MEWSRSPWMRAIAVAASLALIVRYWDERGGWFWLGTVLLVLNLLGLLAARKGVTAGADGAGAATSRIPVGAGTALEPEIDGRRLSELLDVPGVAAALAAGPGQWRQVSYLDDPVESASVEELADHMWVGRDDDGWELAVGDEVKPYLDLDVDEVHDPVCTSCSPTPRSTPPGTRTERSTASRARPGPRCRSSRRWPRGRWSPTTSMRYDACRPRSSTPLLPDPAVDTLAEPVGAAAVPGAPARR